MFQILVVEDDASLRKLMSAALKQHGYVTFLANDGLEAYKARHRMTNAQLGESIGVGRVAVSAILAGKSVQLHSEQFWRVLGAAGLTVSRPKFEGEVTAQ